MSKNIVKFWLVLFFSFARFLANATSCKDKGLKQSLIALLLGCFLIPSAFASISGISGTSGTAQIILAPSSFSATTTSYTATIPNGATSISLTVLSGSGSRITVSVAGNVINDQNNSSSPSAQWRGTVNVTSGTVIQITDDGLNTPTYSLTVAIASPLVVTPNNSAQVYTVGSSVSFSPITASGGFGTKIFMNQGSLPAGLNFNMFTGVLSGTPQAVTAARNVTFTVSDQSGPSNVTSTVSIAVNAASSDPTPTLTFGTPTNAIVAMGGSLTNAATSSISSAGAGAITYSSGTQGVATVNSTTGAITPISVGTSVITATQAAATGVNATATRTYTLTVTLGAQGTFNVSASPSFIAPSTGTSTLSTSGGSGTGAVTYAVTSGASSCTLSGTTVSATSTTGTCTITATKAADSTYSSITATVTITVSNRASIADAVDSSVTGTVLAQATAAQRFSEGQISNVSSHIQSLRNGFNVKNNQVALGLNMPGLDPIKQAAQQLGNAFKQQNAVKVAQNDLSQTKSDVGTIKLAQADVLPSDISVTNTDTDANLNDRLFGNKNIGIWASGNFDYGSIGHNDFRTSGVTAGIDYQLNTHVILGASLGYGFDNTDIDALGSNVKSHQTTGTVYGIYRTDNDWFLDALIGYGDLKMKNNRYSSAASSVFSANRDGDTVFGSVGVAKFFKVQKLDLQPYARLTQMSSSLDAYNEGSNTNALAYDQATIVSRAVSAGVTASYDIVLESGKLTPNAKFELRHNSRGSINQTIAYADTPAEAMTYSSRPAPDDVQSLGLGLNYLAKNGISSDIGWFGSIGSNSYHSNALRLNVRVPF